MRAYTVRSKTMTGTWYGLGQGLSSHSVVENARRVEKHLFSLVYLLQIIIVLLVRRQEGSPSDDITALSGFLLRAHYAMFV